MVNRESSLGLTLEIRRLKNRPNRIRHRLGKRPAHCDWLISFPIDELQWPTIDERRSLAVDLGMLAHKELD